MKMKNMLIGGMSLALVACISIGGTLAYLSDTTDVVTNTFVADAAIQIKLDEAPVDSETGIEQAGARRTSNDYLSIYPGKVVDKDPMVTVTSAPDGGAYVYMSLNGVDEEKMTIQYMGIDGKAHDGVNPDVWQKITAEEGVNGIYKYIGDANNANYTAENGKIVWKAGDAELPTLFDKVKFDYNNSTPTFDDVELYAYSVQATLPTTETKTHNVMAWEVLNPVNDSIWAQPQA